MPVDAQAFAMRMNSSPCAFGSKLAASRKNHDLCHLQQNFAGGIL
jgi:hypothetical protein